MSFWIQNNEKVSSKWRIVNSVLYVIWAITMILRFIVKMRDKANHIESDLQKITSIVFVTAGFLLLILSFVHWLKPKWFENNATKTSKEQEIIESGL